ncbi:MAG: response regulator [Rhodoferax sp.]|uniref:response regulator n=1 Tax=Rhodoferax sp. TaxID=50421 RepID=UPI00301B2A30
MKNILIVEDNAETRKLLTIALKRPTHRIIEASDGLSALKAAKEHKPIVMMLDILMPGGVNGFQVCEMVKSDAELKDTYVILISGLSEASDFEEAKRAGADAYFVKPFRLKRLVEVVINHQKLSGTFTLETML